MFERLDNLWERGHNYNYKDLGKTSKLARTHFFVVQSRVNGRDVALVKWSKNTTAYSVFPYPAGELGIQDLTELAEYCKLKTEQHREAHPPKARKRVRPYLLEEKYA